MYELRGFFEVGGLISYGTDMVAVRERTASYVDRILRGGSPAELPVELPTKYELSLDAKTARRLGLSLPTAFVAQADELFE